MVLLFLMHRRSGEVTEEPTPLDYVLLVLGAAPILYLFINYDYVINRIFYVDDSRRPTWSWA